MNAFFVVIASRTDAAAAHFAAGAGSLVRMMTPADLSQRGWSLHLPGTGPSTAVIAGEPVASRTIAGVLTRLPAVTEHDLPHIIAADRAYVAVEMTAFLLAWLTSLSCPLVNRPSAQCLSGPYWREAQWIRAANRLKVPATGRVICWDSQLPGFGLRLGIRPNRVGFVVFPSRLIRFGRIDWPPEHDFAEPVCNLVPPKLELVDSTVGE